MSAVKRSKRDCSLSCLQSWTLSQGEGDEQLRRRRGSGRQRELAAACEAELEIGRERVDRVAKLLRLQHALRAAKTEQTMLSHGSA